MSAARGRGPGAGPARRGSALDRWLLVVAVVIGVSLYVRSPIDLLPDRMGLLGLVDDLLAAAAAVWWLRRRFPPREETGPRARPRPQPRVPPADAAQPAWDPYRVLQVERGAKAEEITRAYREQMKLYHPDRVAELGPELRKLAHEKSVEIQRAYDEIGRRRS